MNVFFFFCTQLNIIKYSYLIQMICIQWYDFKYSYLIQIICMQLYGLKYFYQIITKIFRNLDLGIKCFLRCKAMELESLRCIVSRLERVVVVRPI